MFAFRFFQCINKSRIYNAVKTFSTINSSVLSQFKRTYFGSATQFKSELSKDNVLFTNEKPKFFIFINLMSTVNCVAWCSYLHYFVQYPVGSKESKEALENIEKAQGGWIWSYILSYLMDYSRLICNFTTVLIVGACLGTFIFTCRSIRSITLHKGGRDITIITYNLGLPIINHKLKLPLSMISSQSTRSSNSNFIPIKIKKKKFYYLIDKNGEFHQPKLFDVTVGIKRNI